MTISRYPCYCDEMNLLASYVANIATNYLAAEIAIFENRTNFECINGDSDMAYVNVTHDVSKCTGFQYRLTSYHRFSSKICNIYGILKC